MPIYAYVLMKARPSEAYAVASYLQQLEFVGLVSVVTGSDDVIALIRADDVASLGEIIVTQIQSLKDYVAETRSMIVVGQLSPLHWLAEGPWS